MELSGTLEERSLVEAQMKKIEDALKVCQDLDKGRGITALTDINLEITKLHEQNAWSAMTQLADHLIYYYLNPMVVDSYLTIYAFTGMYSGSDNRANYHQKFIALEGKMTQWTKLIFAPKTSDIMSLIYSKLKDIARDFAAMSSMREIQRMRYHMVEFDVLVEQ